MKIIRDVNFFLKSLLEKLKRISFFKILAKDVNFFLKSALEKLKRISFLKIFVKNIHSYLKNKKWFVFIQNKNFIKKINRYSSPFILGLGLTLGLFFLMSVLISGGGDLNKSSSDSYFINFLMNASLDDLQIRSRRTIKKPKEPKAPPEMPKMKVKAEVPKPPQLVAQPLPKLSLTKDFTSDLKGVAAGGSSSGDSEVTPIVRIEPLYPRKAALRGLEGFVILKFDITSQGTVSKVNVLQASPPQIFNQSAKQALLRWKYKPRTVSGKPVKQTGLKVKLEFKLEKR